MKLEIYRYFEHSSPLLQFQRDVASQAGEDGIIERIMELLHPSQQFCVEFGAWDGRLYSNCFNLLKNKGWSGIMIEANKDKYRELVGTYAGQDTVTAVNRFVDFEGANALDEFGAPQNFGLLSIDVDGCDYYIWESLSRHSPEVVVIEFNPTVPNDVLFVQARSFDVNHGCSLLALVVMGKQKGYELSVCTAWNAFFVRADKYPQLGIKSNFISNLYVPYKTVASSRATTRQYT